MFRIILKSYFYLPGGLVLLFIITNILNEYTLHLLILCSLFGMLALAQDVAYGRSGQLLICVGAFFAIGAYTSSLLALKIGAPYWLCLLGAVLLASSAGYGIGLAATRVSGHYLAILSIAFSVIVHQVVLNWDTLTNGALGLNNIPHLTLFHYVDFSSKNSFFIISTFSLLITGYLIHYLSNTKIGLRFEAIREDELAAESIGIPVRRVKISAIVISSIIAGIAGSFYAHYKGFIAPDDFTLTQSIYPLMMVILGGANTIIGPILGAILVILLPEYLRALAEYRLVIFGVSIVFFISVLPRGLWGLIQSIITYIRMSKY